MESSADNKRPIQRCIFLLIDGARPDAIEKGVRAGILPNIQKVFFDEGTFRTATTVFPSTTGPAYAPFITGCFPGTCNVPGIRWLDRSKYGNGNWHPLAVRSYVGIESYLMNRDLTPHLRTLFDILSPSVSIFSPINRGVSFRGNRTKLTRAAYWLYAHYTGDWSLVDRAACKKLLRAMDDDFRFLFVVFPGVDEHSHLSEPFSESATGAYVDLDKSIGLLVEKLKARGLYDSTLIVGSSDHGLSQTHTHLELWKLLDDHGLPTLYHPKMFRRGVHAACMVSGNGMANLYLRNGSGWAEGMNHAQFEGTGLLEKLLAQKEVDQVISREGQEAIITTRKGRARLMESNGRIRYRVDGHDPFGFGRMPEEMTLNESLERTAESDYPDAPLQIAQLFRSPRAGDVVVTASPGHDLRYLHEHPEHFSSHGSLHRDHMLVPLMTNKKMNLKKTPRTVDVFPMILAAMNTPLPNYPIDGSDLVTAPHGGHGALEN